MNKKTIWNGLLVIIMILVTFFGLGPVLFADGTNTERMYTLLVVIALYFLIFASFYFIVECNTNFQRF